LKDTARLLLYVAGVLLGGALLAPPLFWLGQSVIAHGHLPSLARYDFDSYFHRAILIAALVLLWPLLRTLEVRSWRGLGLEKNPRPAADYGVGFLVAAIPLLCAGAVLVLLPYYTLRHPFLWRKMPGVLGAVLIVPLLEELLFRGFILGVLLRNCSRGAALVIVSALFSIVHFLKPGDVTVPADAVRWFSGFVSLGHSFWQFGSLPLVAGGLVTLFVIGCVLADARFLTCSLWLPTGLHAGWIFANSLFSKGAHREALALPWIGKDLLVGIVPLMVALISWGLMRGWVRRRRGCASATQ
jgi:membrane protease YdiL (CAAX protease family)